MTGVSISIRSDDLERAGRAIAEAARRVGDLTPLLSQIGGEIEDATQRRFDAQTAPDGARWTPLHPLTAMIRGAAGPILTARGNFRRTVVHQVEGSSVRVGSNAIQAAVHQFGATIRPVAARRLRIPLGTNPQGPAAFAREVVIPARPWLGLSPADASAIEELAEEFLSAPFSEIA